MRPSFLRDFRNERSVPTSAQEGHANRVNRYTYDINSIIFTSTLCWYVISLIYASGSLMNEKLLVKNFESAFGSAEGVRPPDYTREHKTLVMTHMATHDATDDTTRKTNPLTRSTPIHNTTHMVHPA